MLTQTSIGLSAIATYLLLFCVDAFYWHILPLGFEGMLAFGSFAFWFGTALSLLASILAVVALTKQGRRGPSFALCLWSFSILVGFGFIHLKH